MLPTLQDDTYGVGKVVEDVTYNDIVVVRTDEYGDIIKRVIGKAGDHIVMNRSGTYVNGKQTEFQFNNPNVEIETIVPENKVFVAGDNRHVSLDSRYFGAIDTSLIECILVTNTVDGHTYFTLRFVFSLCIFLLLDLDEIILWFMKRRRKFKDG